MSIARKIVPLFALFTLSFVIFGCTTDETVEARYEAERLYNQAESLSAKAHIRPDLSTGENLQQLFAAYHEVLDTTLPTLQTLDSSRYPDDYLTLAAITHRSAIRLTKMYFDEDKFDTCIGLMSTMITKTRLPRDETISVYYNLAQALQSSGRIDSALTVYRYIIDNFNPPLTRENKPIAEVLNLPLFLIHVASLSHDSTGLKQKIDRAEQYYQGLAQDYPNSSLAIAANGNLARLYYDAGRWDQAIDYLSRMTDSTGRVALSARFRIADIQATFKRDYRGGIKTLDEIESSLSGRDTIFVPVTRFKKGLVYLEQGATGQARGIFSEIQTDYPGYYQANPRVQYMKARSFDLENNWDRAETEYKYLVERFGDSREGLATALYLAQKLKDQGRTSEAEIWYTEAEQEISLMIARGAGTPREALALTYKADLYRAQDRWVDAAQALTTAYERFPTEKIGRDCLLAAVDIYRGRLRQPEIADSLMLVLKKSLPIKVPEWES